MSRGCLAGVSRVSRVFSRDPPLCFCGGLGVGLLVQILDGGRVFCAGGSCGVVGVGDKPSAY